MVLRVAGDKKKLVEEKEKQLDISVTRLHPRTRLVPDFWKYAESPGKFIGLRVDRQGYRVGRDLRLGEKDAAYPYSGRVSMGCMAALPN